MKIIASTFLGAAALTLALAAPSSAADEGEISSVDCRVEVIPARTECVTREILTPPVTCERRVPRFETVMQPVFETRHVPEYETVEVAVYDTREVPVYRTEKVPVWGEEEVTVYRKECEPVTICLPNPFGSGEVTLWNRSVDVPCGTELQPAIVGYDELTVQCGTRSERYVAGTETREVVVGHRTEQVQVGERPERHLVGYDTETVVVRPAETRTVTEEVCVPARAVTVVPTGSERTEPLPGTDEVLTEDELEAEVRDLR